MLLVCFVLAGIADHQWAAITVIKPVALSPGKNA